MDNAVILSACRTPIGSFGGVFKDLSAADLGAIVLREAIARAGIDAADIGDVIMGCVLQAGAGMNVARQAAIKAGVPVEVPAETINRVCGSGLQAVVHAVEAVKAGYIDLMLAGGTESMSNAPFLLKGARWGYRMGNAELVDSMLQEGLTCAIEGCHMGMTAEEVARRYAVTREQQDAFAAESQQRAEIAVQSGVFDREIVAVEVAQRKGPPLRVTQDEYPRSGTTAGALAALRPAFSNNGTVTAGNASGINDGAAALVVATAKKADELGRRPLARILSYCTTGVAPKVMGIGPVEAMRRAVERAGLSLADLDLIELNEAFASQSLAVARELALDPARVNVHGGAIALGHPIGASGARVLTTLVHALQARGGGRGAAALCIGGGMGTAMIVEAG
jgi:acetyl-CoA C-acetyltransferase